MTVKFKRLVNSVWMKILKVCGILYKFSYLLPDYILRNIYIYIYIYNISIVYPHFIYAIHAWGGCGKIQLDRLQALQNKSIKIFYVDNSLQISGIYKRHRLLNISHINFYFIALHVHKLFNYNDEYFLNKIR